MQPAEAIIDRVYEAMVIPEFWPSILHDLSIMSGCVGGTLFTADRHQVVSWVSSEALTGLMERFSQGPWQALNTRPAKAAAARHAGFLLDHDLYTPEEMDADPVYRDLYRPMGFGWATGTIIPMPSGDLAVYNLERRYADGPVPRSAVALLDSLRPHLARSAVMATRLHLERTRATVDALESVGLPAAVVTREGRMLAANAALMQLEGQFVFLARDRFALADVGPNALLGAALSRLDIEGGRSIPIPAKGESAPAVVHILPVRRNAADIFSRAHAVVVVTPLDREVAPDADLLSGLFDLTPSEANVAKGIGAGMDLSAIAHGRGVSLETVRSQIKAVLAKTGMERQADLVGLLTRIDTVRRS